MHMLTQLMRGCRQCADIQQLQHTYPYHHPQSTPDLPDPLREPCSLSCLNMQGVVRAAMHDSRSHANSAETVFCPVSLDTA